MRNLILLAALHLSLLSIGQNHQGDTYIYNGRLYISHATGIGDHLFNADGPTGRNFGVSSFRPLQGELRTRVGINMAINGGDGITHYALVGAKKSPFIELNAENGSISLYGENGTGGDWRVVSSSTHGLHVTGNGYVGVGTESPITNLEIVGNGTSAGFKIRHENEPQGWGFNFLHKSDFSAVIENSGYDLQLVSGWDKKLILGHSEYDTYGGEILIPGGNVGIGTDPCPNCKLDVKGNIRSEEVTVEISNGPDYVFEENYDLRSLKDIEAYISENKHLPEVPSAKEMESNGVALGEMNMLLLKKIEELTLYQIELMKRIEQLEAKKG